MATQTHDVISVLTQDHRAVEDLFADEEGNLFPRLAEHVEIGELVTLGERVESAKKMAPTRPHPSTPSRPPLNKVLAPGAGLVDRARDHLSGRGRD